jgi:hypothetical protein
MNIAIQPRVRDRGRDALIKRINTQLAKMGRKLKVARRESLNLGEYFIIDVHGNHIVDHHVDIHKLGDELWPVIPAQTTAATA